MHPLRLIEKCCNFAITTDNKTTMEIKEYDNSQPATMASEPAVAYLSTTPAKPLTTSRIESMSVDEYFDKVRKALDKRYGNL